MQGAFRIPLEFDTGTNKVVIGDGNDYEPFSLPAYTGADASIVTAVSDPVTGGIEFSACGIVTKPGTNARRLAIIGDSFTAPDGPTSWTDNLWWVHALAELRWPYEVVAVSATNGWTTEQMRDAFDSDIAPHKPDAVWILAGQNNAVSVAAAYSGLAALDEIINKCRSIGVMDIVAGTPCASTTPTTTQRDSLVVFSNGLLERARNQNLRIADAWGAYRDAASVSGGADSTLVRGDSLHPNRKGARRIGSAWASAVFPMVTISRLGEGSRGAGDQFPTTTASNERIVNAAWLGTSGTKAGDGTITGNVPDGWTLVAPAGLTIALSIVTETLPRQRRWLKMSISGALAADDSLVMVQPISMGSIGVSNGDALRSRLAIKQSGLNPTIHAVEQGLTYFTDGYSPAGGTYCGGGASSYGAGEVSDIEIVKETAAGVIGSNGAVAAIVQPGFTLTLGAGAISGYIQITDWSVRKLG